MPLSTTTEIGTIQRTDALAPGTWALDPAHTTIEFVARHMVVAKSRGRFGGFSGIIQVNEDPTRSAAEATIEAASIDTRHEQRDGHLRSPDFLDAVNHPLLKFRSISFEHVGGPRWRVLGELTIRDITRPIELDVEFGGLSKSPWGADVAFFSATGEINREDYGMTWNQSLETGGVLVSKTIEIEIHGEALRQ
ncbi:MAG: YceI family protein [Actinomycetota bacterium]